MVRKSGRSRDHWEDHWAQRAKKEGRRARSVYKLEEIDQRFGILRPGNRVLDLGCYPGSWVQYSLERVEVRGEVIGIDLKRPADFTARHFRFFQGDVLTLELEWLKRQVGPMDVVLSDLAPVTSGIRSTDTVRSLTLARRALEIALMVLKEKGHFICKVFEGEGFGSFLGEVSKYFGKTKPLRPNAVRKKSREVYVVGLGLADPVSRNGH